VKEEAMTNPNLRYSMADVRRWAFYNIGAYMTRIDTGIVHGPEEVWWSIDDRAPACADQIERTGRAFGWDAVPDTRDVRPERDETRYVWFSGPDDGSDVRGA
jgi:hypothetical protein